MAHTTIPVESPRYKLAVIIWVGLYPTTLVAMLTVEPALAMLPLPLKTLALNSVVVPTMIYVVLPIVNHLFARWLAADAHEAQ